MITKLKTTSTRDALKCDVCSKEIEKVRLYTEQYDGKDTISFTINTGMQYGGDFLKSRWFAEGVLIVANGQHYHEDCFVEKYVPKAK